MPADLAVALDLAVRQKASAGDFVMMQGEAADRIFYLSDGKLRLSQITPEGQQVVMRMFSAGSLFGLIAVSEGMEYPLSAQALDDCDLLVWTGADLRALIKRFPQMTSPVITFLAGSVREFQSRFTQLATERVERRLARSLLRLASQTGVKTAEGVLINLPLSRQDLAEMSGASLFTASRILSQWEQQGLVVTGREKVTIRRPHGLVCIAEDLPARKPNGS
jgi:CRP/FNR family transcriptional regulator, nitrogen oxide reductase regulator